jgi:hypothetical protein
MKEIARTARKIFHVSDRRRSQVPAVAFLVNVLAESLRDVGGIKEARFCQGDVREGVLFQELPDRIRGQDPLKMATQPFAHTSVRAIRDLRLCALPGMSRKLCSREAQGASEISASFRHRTRCLCPCQCVLFDFPAPPRCIAQAPVFSRLATA